MSDISWIEFTEHSILYDIDGDKKDINYSDIRSYREWKNDIFVETYDEKTLVVPCNNKIELHNVSILLKEKIRKEFKISCSNKKEWVDKIYSTFQKAKKTKLFIISLWLNFSYFYMTGLDFKNFNFVKAFAVRTYVEGSTFRCFRVYEVLIVCFILTIIAYINDLQYKRKIEKWY